MTRIRIALLMAGIAGVLALNACTPQQVATGFDKAQDVQAKIEAAIVEGCGAVNAAAAIAAPFAAVPQVGAILSFAEAGCGTAGAVSALVTKAVNDPSTILWTQRLAGQLHGAAAMARGR
jgi:hypothetical protein